MLTFKKTIERDGNRETVFLWTFELKINAFDIKKPQQILKYSVQNNAGSIQFNFGHTCKKINSKAQNQ